MKDTNKSMDIYVGINKDGTMRMFTDTPTRNEKIGKWESKHPFVNSKLYIDFSSLCERSCITWDCEPNMFSVQINKEPEYD